MELNLDPQESARLAALAQMQAVYPAGGPAHPAFAAFQLQIAAKKLDQYMVAVKRGMPPAIVARREGAAMAYLGGLGLTPQTLNPAIMAEPFLPV